MNKFIENLPITVAEIKQQVLEKLLNEPIEGSKFEFPILNERMLKLLVEVRPRGHFQN